MKCKLCKKLETDKGYEPYCAICGILFYGYKPKPF